MALLTRKRTILAKIESSYGVDPTPTGGSNAILVRNLTVTPLNAELVSRDLVRPYFGNSDTLLAQTNGIIEFEVEMAGSVSPGVAPAWAPLLKACGFAEDLNTESVSITRSGSTATATLASHGFTSGATVVISGATQSEYNGSFVISNVTTNTFDYTVSGTPATPATGSPVVGTTSIYTPISDSLPSIAFYFQLDGVRQKHLGCRGNVEFTVNVKQIPVMKFTFTSLYSAPTDTSAPSVDFSAFQQPKIANTTNTTSFSLLSYSGYMEQFNMNMTNDVQYRTLIGYQSVELLDRKPAGTFLIEAPLMASKDYFTAAVNGTTGVMQLIHGTTSGNIVKLRSERVSIGNPSYQESQGVQMLSIPYVATPTSGNDELTVTVY